MDRVTVTYLGHSAWIVDSPDSIYIFDYDKPPGKNNNLDLNKLQGKPVYFFASHVHGDHYSARLSGAVAQYANMTFITGGFRSKNKNDISIMPRQSLAISGVSVATAASTDAGVCFLVQKPGLTVFHSGDLANWPDNDETPVDYFREIDYIAALADATDIAFIPVTTFAGLQDTCLLEGAAYAVKKLNPRYVFPMHANGREGLYKTFAAYASDNGVSNTVICMEQPGDTWVSPEIPDSGANSLG